MSQVFPATPGPDVQHIWCSAGIFKKMEDVLVGYISNQAQMGRKVDEYVVYLATTGGSPFSGIALYNFIKSLPQTTTVYNMGNVDSAGIPLFLGFQRRFGVPGCSFLVHQTVLPRSALPEYFNVFDLRRQMSSLEATDQKTHQIILDETRAYAMQPLTEEELQQAALNSTTFSADLAREKGFIEAIQRPRLPASGLFYLTDQYLATLPGQRMGARGDVLTGPGPLAATCAPTNAGGG
jgi:ATP-dependent protease ClpP protease subunit